MEVVGSSSACFPKMSSDASDGLSDAMLPNLFPHVPDQDRSIAALVTTGVENSTVNPRLMLEVEWNTRSEPNMRVNLT